MFAKPFGGAFRICIAASLIAAGFVLGPATTSSAAWLNGEKQLTTNTSGKGYPEISGTKIAYADFRNYHAVVVNGDPMGLVDVRVLDFKTGKDQLITAKHDLPSGETPVVSGNFVVWRAYTQGKFRLWYRNLSGKHPNAMLRVTGANVQIDGNRLCYQRSGRIWVYDLKTKKEKVVSPKGLASMDCHIKGSTVVWDGYSPDAKAGIYAYNLSSKKLTRVTSGTTTQSPRTDGTWVTYLDTSSGFDVDVYAYNFKTHVGGLVKAHVTGYADISGARITFKADSGVWVFDLVTGVTTLVTATGTDARISGNRIVYVDDKSGTDQFYLRTIIPPTVTAGAPKKVAKSSSPLVSGTLSWAGSGVFGKSVTVQYSTNNKTWHTGATTLTNLEGHFSVTGPVVTKTTWIRVKFAGSIDFAPAMSATLKVKKA